MADTILIVIIVSVIVGIKTPTIGSIVGSITAGLIYYFFNTPFDLKTFALHIIIGAIFGYLSPATFRWIFSGFRGVRGQTVPGVTWIGGFGDAGGRYPGGIIPTEDQVLENKFH